MAQQNKKVSPYSYVGIMYDDIMRQKDSAVEMRIVSDIAVHEVLRIVSEETGISEEDIISPCKRQEIVDARYIYFAALKHKFNLSLEKIGKMVGNRDHTTVINGLRRFEDRYKYEASYKRRANNVFVRINLQIDDTKKKEAKFLNSIIRFSSFVFFCTILWSCNPKMHIIGYGMRKFNTSLNKYSKNKPYVDKNLQIKK